MIIGHSSSNPLIIADYGSGPDSQIGAVQTSSGAGKTTAVRSSGWVLQWVEVTRSASRGISLSDDMTIFGCRIVFNGRLGIGGGGTGITISHSVISENGIDATRQGWEAGGVKTVGSRVKVEDDVINGNGAAGVWTDSGAEAISVVNNTLSGNAIGVHIEISKGVSVSGNAIARSTMQSVLVVASSGVSVSGNRIHDNHGGIIVGGVHREGPDGITLENVSVSGNSVADSGVTGVTQPLLTGMTVHFDRDHFIRERLTWEGRLVTFQGLQALGQEMNGTFSS